LASFIEKGIPQYIIDEGVNLAEGRERKGGLMEFFLAGSHAGGGDQRSKLSAGAQ
jgi:hypothetical protein